MTLTFAETHNMIAYLTKSDASEGFNKIIDFFNGSSIKYALTVNPNIYVSCIKQFWTSVAVKKVNDITRLQALVDKKKVVIMEATLRDALRLDDAEGIECLPNEEIFAELARMGYEKPSTKLTFYKAFFLSQWKFMIYTILQCMSAKRTSWNEFSSSMASAVIRLSTMEQQVDEGADEVHDEGVPAIGVVAEGVVSAADDEVPTAVEEPSIPTPTPPPQPSQDQPSTSQDKIAQALEITKLKQRVKKLERRNKASKLQRLKRVGTAQSIETFDVTVMDDVSKQGRIIANMDADNDVILEDAKEVVVEKSGGVDESVDVQGRKAESKAQIYQIDLEHANKVLSIAIITAAAPQLTIVAASTLTTIPSAARRRKGVVIRDPQESATPSTIIHSEAKSKDNGNGFRKQKEDNAVKRYQALKKKPQTEAQARMNMMIYLRNVAGFKMDYFKGMTYDDIRPIFEKHFESNVAFLLKTKEQMDEEDNRALRRLNESQEDKAAKKQKLDEEVEELKRHLQIVPNDEDDVYTEATPLALKVPVVDYEIYNEHNKPYFKSNELTPKNFSNDFLLITLGAMFEKPDIQAQIWKNQRSVHGQAKVKSWKLLESCGVQIITFTTTQLILLVERRYSLTRFTLDQMLNNVRLEVEEESEVSLELLRFIRQ
uniref:Xylulose kinase-1 n=1 Tax=Tanacetum cinerariifolium TaxID=118510 RepID=A0A6L2NAM4_TANCI|nr:hypothetical protein [Tanacetum cinerariifolium]